MNNKILPLFLFVICINLVSAIPVCSDTNSQDISKMPCLGFTVPIACSGNVTAFNATNSSMNFTFDTYLFVDNVYNFTLDLSSGEYQLFDCENNTATFVIGFVEQGYGINLFGIIFPSILLTLISLCVSGRLFHEYKNHDQENRASLIEDNDEDSFMPKSRLMPIIFLLFSFIPMIFMVGFVNIYLEQFLPTANVTTFYGFFYVLFSTVFYFVFLISFLVWLGSFIKLRRVMKGLDDIE